MSSVKNILFDLGNVIIDIDIPRTSQELFKLFRRQDLKDQIFEELKPVLQDYETGKLSDELFINSLLRYARPQVYAQQIIRAWNAMLIDIPPERLEFLKVLRTQKYNLYLLSNTNRLHLSWINNYLNKNFNIPSLDVWFDRSYYSHVVQLRKPQVSCFEFVLHDAGLLADETLFIDDTLENIDSAKSLGIRTLYLTGGHEVIKSLKNYLSLKD
jgi:HAD superfamily hydrolase (TIGR01509 family)